MNCPFCGNKTEIYNTRHTNAASQTWRRHKCVSCSRTFTTRERIDLTNLITIADATGTESGYSPARLALSIVRATDKLHLPPSSAFDLHSTIEQQLQSNGFFQSPYQSASKLADFAFAILARYNQHVALQYINSVYDQKPPQKLLKRLVGA